MSLIHLFSIDYWRDWKNPATPAPSLDGRQKTKPVQPEWAAYRYRFMVDHTLRSLAEQTNPSPVFIYVEPHYRDIVAGFESKNPLPAGCRIITSNLFDIVLAETGDFEHLYLTRMDSDDLFHRSVAEEIKAASPRQKTLVYRNGYVYDTPTKNLDYYSHPSPPFYTDCYTRAEVENHQRIKRVGHGQHGGQIRYLSDGKFVVMCHRNEMQCTTNYAYMQQISKKFAALRAKGGYPLSDMDTLENFGCAHCLVTRTAES